MLSTVETADDYFSINFMGKDAWAAIADEDKALVLETAENDINSYLMAIYVDSGAVKGEKPYTPYQVAIFEWALYLYQNKAKIVSMVNERVGGATTIAVDGIGRNTYAQATGSRGSDPYNATIMNSNAGRFLRMIYPDVRILR